MRDVIANHPNFFFLPSENLTTGRLNPTKMSRQMRVPGVSIYLEFKSKRQIWMIGYYNPQDYTYPAQYTLK
jgi:hypothetical protein